MKKSKHPIFKLEDIIVDLSGGSTPKVGGDYYTLKDEGIPFLRVQNITKMGLDLNEVKYIKKDVHNSLLKRSQLIENDVILTITGRIGTASVVPKDFLGNINQHSVRFALKNEVDGIKIDVYYIVAYLNSLQGTLLSYRNVTGTTRPALDYNAIKNLKIIIPPSDIQYNIAKKFKSRIEHIAELRKLSLKTLENAQLVIESMLTGG